MNTQICISKNAFVNSTNHSQNLIYCNKHYETCCDTGCCPRIPWYIWPIIIGTTVLVLLIFIILHLIWKNWKNANLVAESITTVEAKEMIETEILIQDAAHIS